jgi:hypothetical protein
LPYLLFLKEITLPYYNRFMGKAFLAVVFLASILATAFFVDRHYRILPLENTVTTHHPDVLSAASGSCKPDVQLGRTIVLRTDPDLASLKINQQKLPANMLHDILTEILRTRVDRTIYLVDNSARDNRDSMILEKMLQQLPVVSRICVIDPQNPPAWYPLKPYLAGGGGGTNSAL